MRVTEDFSLRVLLGLPFLMAALSLLMWRSLPTRGEVLLARGPQLDAHLLRLERIARTLSSPATWAPSSCAALPNPRPRYSEDQAASNMEILGAQQLHRLRLKADFDSAMEFYVGGNLYWMLTSRVDFGTRQSSGGRRYGKKRVEREVDRPLETPYVAIYATRMTDTLRQSPSGEALGAVAVAAVLFELKTAHRLCAVSFVEHIDPAFRHPSEFDRWAWSQLWSQAGNRLIAALTAAER